MKVWHVNQRIPETHCKHHALAGNSHNHAFYLPLIAPLLLTLSVSLQAQDAASTPRLLENLGAAQGGVQTSKPGDKPGTSFAEILRGNGTRTGYVLSHGRILPGTISITAGGTILRANRDYVLDSENGTVYFMQPVRSYDTISVYYRYLEGQDNTRQPLAMPGIALNFGKATSLNFVYGMSAGSGDGINVSTVGLNLASKFGAGGQSSYNGLFYFSNTQKSDNVVLPTRALASAPKEEAKQALGASQLIAQNLAVQAGGLQVRASFQDVGKDFAGFQSLRQNNAGNKAMLDQLAMLEGEKGIQRTGLGLGLNFGPKGKQPGGLSFDTNQIQDGNGSINFQSAKLDAGALRLRFDTRSVDETFQLFKGLRDADKAQWEQEKGMKTTSLGLGLNFGSAKKGSLPGALNFESQDYTDKSGSFNRQAWQLNAGGFGLTMLNRRSDKAFARMNNLSAADKTMLALDLHRQYNPAAQAAQVTPNDIAQVAREAGLSRDALQLQTSLGKSGAFAFSQLSVQDAAASPEAAPNGFRRDSLTLQTGSLSLEMVNRRTDNGFTRLADLADIEKTYLALDIRRQFDPNATPDQVQQKERDQAAREAGLSRDALRGNLKFGKGSKQGTFSLNQFRIASETTDKTIAGKNNTIRRQSYTFSNNVWQFFLLNQSIGSEFTRLADLGDFERALFANERGMQRQQRNLAVQINKQTRLTYSGLKIGGTSEAVASAMEQARADGKDIAAAARAAGSSFSRQNVAFETRGFNLAANFADTAKHFSRAADLALTDPEKQNIERERGFRRSDFTTRFSLYRGLALDSYTYSAVNSEDSLSRDTFRHNLQYTPNKRLSLTYLSDGDLTGASGLKNGLVHSLLTFNKDFGKGMQINYYKDDNALYDQGVVTAQSTRTEFARFQSDQEKPNAFSYENKRINFEGQKYEYTSNINVRAKPSRSFSIGYARQDIDREEKDPSENTDKLDFQWQTSKSFSIIAGLSQRDTTDNKQDINTVSVGMQGEPFKNVTLTAKYDELHHVSQNTKGVADISLSNAKPFKFGPITDLMITARYASLNDVRKLQNETMTGRASFKIWKNEFLLDYGGFTMPNGTSTIARVYSFVTDPNPKKWLHGSFLYKSRTMIDGQELAIRRFTADARLSKRTHFTYLFGTLPEDDKGNPVPTTTADVSLKHAFRPNQTLSLFYRLSDHALTKVLTRSLGFSFEGRLSSNSKIEIGYSADANGFADRYFRAHHYRFAYDQQFHADHFITLSTDIRSNSGNGMISEFQANLEFRRRF